MHSYTIDDIRTRLPQILQETPEQETVLITENSVPVAALLRLPKAPLMDDPEAAIVEQPELPPGAHPQPVFGSCRGLLTIVSDDEDHLQDFAEYMP